VLNPFSEPLSHDPPAESKELKIQWMSCKGFIRPIVSSWGTSGLYEEERHNLMVMY